MPDPVVATENTASTPSPLPQTQTAGTTPITGADSNTRRLAVWVLLLLLVVGIALVIAFFNIVRHWLAVHSGTLHGGPDVYYNFWSGIGSDIGEATLISAVGIGVYTGVRKVNCHTTGCWRIGHHPLDGTPYILCRHHHPEVPTKGASHEHILEQHRKHLEAKRLENC